MPTYSFVNRGSTETVKQPPPPKPEPTFPGTAVFSREDEEHLKERLNNKVWNWFGWKTFPIQLDGIPYLAAATILNDPTISQAIISRKHPFSICSSGVPFNQLGTATVEEFTLLLYGSSGYEIPLKDLDETSKKRYADDIFYKLLMFLNHYRMDLQQAQMNYLPLCSITAESVYLMYRPEETRPFPDVRILPLLPLIGDGYTPIEDESTEIFPQEFFRNRASLKTDLYMLNELYKRLLGNGEGAYTAKIQSFLNNSRDLGDFDDFIQEIIGEETDASPHFVNPEPTKPKEDPGPINGSGFCVNPDKGIPIKQKDPTRKTSAVSDLKDFLKPLKEKLKPLRDHFNLHVEIDDGATVDEVTEGTTE